MIINKRSWTTLIYHQLNAQTKSKNELMSIFPSWVIDSLDREASRIGVTRQSIIKLWLVERLEEKAANK